MNSYRVVVVLVCTDVVSRIWVACWSKLNVDILTDACWDHAFFLVTDFEIWCLRWQNVQPLRRWWVIDNTDFKCMCFIYFKTCEFDNWRGGLENSIGANCVKNVMGSDRIRINTFASVDQLLLNLEHILRLRNRNLIQLNPSCSLWQLGLIWGSQIIRASSLRVVPVSNVEVCKPSSGF